MTLKGYACAFVSLVCLLPVPTAAGQNNSAATAQNVVAGQPAWHFTSNNTTVVDYKWYVFGARSGRSYCVETSAYQFFENGTNGAADTAILVYRADGTTIIVSNDDTIDEPLSGTNYHPPSGNYGLSRACFIAQNNEQTFISLAGFNAGSNNYTARLVETTLFSNWFFLGGDYQSYTLLRNTTNQPVSCVIVWRNAEGNAVSAVEGVLPPNGSIYKNGRDFSGALAATSGTVEVFHTGAPDAIVASTTVLSLTTGLSFDAPFMKRTPW